MAKIYKSEAAPEDATKFSVGNVEFDFGDGDSVETSDREELEAARGSFLFNVEEDTVASDSEAATPDFVDPHVNRAADHLAVQASPEAIEAAAKNEAAIRDAAGVSELVSASGSQAEDNPSVADALRQTFEIVGADGEPAFVSEDEPATPKVSPTPKASVPQPSYRTTNDGDDD